SDPEGQLRSHAAGLVRSCTRGSEDALDDLLVQIAAALPEISTLFEVRISRPEHLQAISDHAKELLILRNLREIQEATQARHDAQVSEERMRRLTEQSRRDPLTGVYNRLQMEEVLEREFATALALQH